MPAASLESLGFALVIFPGGLARRLGHAAREYFEALKRDGSTDALRERMLDFAGLNKALGTPEMLNLGKKYDA